MENKKIIIGLTGQIACGKGVIKRYIDKKYGAADFRFSTILRDILKRLHVEETREHTQNLSTFLRQAFGEDVLAKTMAEDIKNSPDPIVVIDGVRRLADIKYLRELNEFKLIRVVANRDIRYKRVLSRNENPGDDKKTWEEFMGDEDREPERQIPETMAAADYEINNEDSLEELEKKIDEIIAKMR